MHRIALLTILLVVAKLITYANGDPVARFSSINRVRNPQPISIPEIRIVREKLKITHVDGYNCFDVTYTFKNESKKDFPEIDYGFPIDYLIIDELETYCFHDDLYTESIYEVGWDERLIKDVSFTFNNSELAFSCSKESVKDISFEINPYDDKEEKLVPVEGINRRWFYTQFSMKPREEATLNVRYKVYANAYTPAMDYSKFFVYYNPREISDEYDRYKLSFINRYCPEGFQIFYDFSPAKHFGENKPYYLEIDIDLSNLDNPMLGSDHTLWYANRMKRFEYNVKADEINPIDLTVYLGESSLNKILNQTIDKLAVSETKYVVTVSDDSIYINFHEPIFVSDLACDIDVISLKQIDAVVTYNDGRQNSYKFERKELNEDSSQELESVLTLLTITDIYDNMSAKNDLKIKSIKLNPVSAPISSVKSIKVIDARF
ncbi:MAG: hypothetical protein K2J10_09085 [Muribaculaceae bacterium]|nr:hypothetical protein [Muribaculaceae bacterium]